MLREGEGDEVRKAIVLCQESERCGVEVTAGAEMYVAHTVEWSREE